MRWCLAHNPDLRPSPTELLQRSDLFPPQPEDEDLEALTRLISLPDHALFRPYLASLFDQPLHDRMYVIEDFLLKTPLIRVCEYCTADVISPMIFTQRTPPQRLWTIRFG